MYHVTCGDVLVVRGLEAVESEAFGDNDQEPTMHACGHTMIPNETMSRPQRSSPQLQL